MTGAGRGIGRAIAELLAYEGAKVVTSARTNKELEETATAIKATGGKAVARVADIGSARGAELSPFAVRVYGRFDLLITKAGILGPRLPI
ncbi:MAG: NAD(P)-dependent oxidoreductase, partial [Nitrospiraceae bacterium]